MGAGRRRCLADEYKRRQNAIKTRAEGRSDREKQSGRNKGVNRRAAAAALFAFISSLDH